MFVSFHIQRLHRTNFLLPREAVSQCKSPLAPLFQRGESRMSKNSPFFQRGIKGDFHGRVPMLRIATVRGRFVEPINSIATQPPTGEDQDGGEERLCRNTKTSYFPSSVISSAARNPCFDRRRNPRSVLRCS